MSLAEPRHAKALTLGWTVYGGALDPAANLANWDGGSLSPDSLDAATTFLPDLGFWFQKSCWTMNKVIYCHIDNLDNYQLIKKDRHPHDFSGFDSASTCAPFAGFLLGIVEFCWDHRSSTKWVSIWAVNGQDFVEETGGGGFFPQCIYDELM